MNLELADRIRAAIRDTTGAIAHQETPYPTRTALQAHLDALLKEELQALTGQAPEGNLAGFAEQNEKFAQDMGLRQASADAMVARAANVTPWYPDDSGDWVEVLKESGPDFPDTNARYECLTALERKDKIYHRAVALGCNWCKNNERQEDDPIVAYKVVKP